MTTPDPVALKEALDRFSKGMPPLANLEGDFEGTDEHSRQRYLLDAALLISAARWALDLIEGAQNETAKLKSMKGLFAADLIKAGKEVWWCVDDDGRTHGGYDVAENHCYFTSKDRHREGCGKRLLVTPVSETTRETYLRTAHASDEPGSRDSSAR